MDSSFSEKWSQKSSEPRPGRKTNGEENLKNKCFDSYRRALFRHLTDADYLKRNPLSERFILDAPDREGLIRLTIAEQLRLDDLQVGPKSRADRHFAAIVRCDLNKEPQKAVAAEGGLLPRFYATDN